MARVRARVRAVPHRVEGLILDSARHIDVTAKDELQLRAPKIIFLHGNDGEATSVAELAAPCP